MSQNARNPKLQGESPEVLAVPSSAEEGTC